MRGVTARAFRRMAFGCVLAWPAAALGMADRPRPRPPAAPLTVSGWLVSTWDYPDSLNSFQGAVDVLSQVSPVWWRVGPDGGAIARLPGGATGVSPGPSEADVTAVCRACGIQLIPLISNVGKGGFDPDLVHRLIADPGRRTAHVRALATIVRAHGYDGIEIDYEEMHGSDREAFTAFLTELAAALHADGKVLAAAVHPKLAEPGDDWGPMAQDWAAIGRVVDSFRVMTYDHHWATGAAGAIGPLPWFKQVLAFAVSQVPPRKVQMGVPVYGYDWTGSRTGRSEDVDAREAASLARRVGARVRWDREANEPRFEYDRHGRRHEVWYEDARCLPDKLAAVRAAGAGGIAIWRLGSEEAAFWERLREGARRP